MKRLWKFDRMRPKPFLPALALFLLECGGGGDGGPTGPDTEPLPQLSISVSPTPVPAVLQSATQTTATLAVVGEVTFTERDGTGGRITRITGQVILDGTSVASGSLDLDLRFVGTGSASEILVQEFTISEPFTSARWRLSASGVDESGRAFQVSQVEVPIELTVPPAPAAEVFLFGDTNYSVFLGCFTCSRFDSDSVHNPFGQYGSRFSSTSIWNPFSSYGSDFSNDSACNEFASNPPILVDGQGTFLGELTLNLFRPNAIRDSDIVDWLRNIVCEE